MQSMSDHIIRKTHTGEPGNGGEFGTHSRTEAPTGLLAPVRPAGALHLDDGDTLDLVPADYGMDHLGSLTVTRVGVSYEVAADIPIPVLDWAPEGTIEQQAVWAENRLPALRSFIRDRYGAILEGTDTWDDTVERMQAATAAVTTYVPQDADGSLHRGDLDAAVRSGGAGRIAAEFDDGAWNSPNASNAFRDYIAKRSIAAAAGTMDTHAIDAEVSARIGVREVRGETARSIARYLAEEVRDGRISATNVGALNEFTYRGHAPQEKLMDDLRHLYTADRRERSRQWMSMLMTWSIHGTPDDEQEFQA